MNESLAHSIEMGEVDPRTYPLLGTVKLNCEVIGSNERMFQVGAIARAVERIAKAEGDKLARTHFTVAPETSAVNAIEVRIQPLSWNSEFERDEFIRKIQGRWDEVLAQGSQGGWQKA